MQDDAFRALTPDSASTRRGSSCWLLEYPCPHCPSKPAGCSPTDSELMQMMRQQQGQQPEILLRLQAMEDARASTASARGAAPAGATVPAGATEHELVSWQTEDDDPPQAPQWATRQPRVRLAATPLAREPVPAEYSDGDGDGGNGEGYDEDSALYEENERRFRILEGQGSVDPSVSLITLFSGKPLPLPVMIYHLDTQCFKFKSTLIKYYPDTQYPPFSQVKKLISLKKKSLVSGW